MEDREADEFHDLPIVANDPFSFIKLFGGSNKDGGLEEKPLFSLLVEEKEPFSTRSFSVPSVHRRGKDF